MTQEELQKKIEGIIEFNSYDEATNLVMQLIKAYVAEIKVQCPFCHLHHVLGERGLWSPKKAGLTK